MYVKMTASIYFCLCFSAFSVKNRGGGSCAVLSIRSTAHPLGYVWKLHLRKLFPDDVLLFLLPFRYSAFHGI